MGDDLQKRKKKNKKQNEPERDYNLESRKEEIS